MLYFTHRFKFRSNLSLFVVRGVSKIWKAKCQVVLNNTLRLSDTAFGFCLIWMEFLILHFSPPNIRTACNARVCLYGFPALRWRTTRNAHTVTRTFRIPALRVQHYIWVGHIKGTDTLSAPNGLRRSLEALPAFPCKFAKIINNNL